MGEAAVLHTAAVEELIVFARQRQSHAFLLESRGGSGVQHLAVGAEVGHGKGFGHAVDLHLHSRCGEGVVAVGSDELHLAGRLAGLLHEDVGLGLGDGLSHSVAHGVLEISEDVGAVEVDGDFLPTFVEQFYGVVVDFACTVNLGFGQIAGASLHELQFVAVLCRKCEGGQSTAHHGKGGHGREEEGKLGLFHGWKRRVVCLCGAKLQFSVRLRKKRGAIPPLLLCKKRQPF